MGAHKKHNLKCNCVSGLGDSKTIHYKDYRRMKPEEYLTAVWVCANCGDIKKRGKK